MDIQNKVVLISGANRGLGKALVEQAAKSGAKKIYAAARDINSLKLPNDPKFVKVSLDLNEPFSIDALAQKCADVQVLINNAGVFSAESVLTGEAKNIKRDFDTNFCGTLQVIRVLAPALMKNRDSAIVNLLSVASLAGMAAMGGYSVSKAALFSATQSMRKELKNKGISVFAVFPGPMDTDMTKGIEMPKTAPEEVAKNILSEIQAGHEDIFPDPMSQQVGQLWSKDPKALERYFASM